jgi:hypothetical protein
MSLHTFTHIEETQNVKNHIKAGQQPSRII